MGLGWSKEEVLGQTVLLTNGKRLGFVHYNSAPTAEQVNELKEAARAYDIIYVAVIGSVAITPDQVDMYMRQNAGVYLCYPQVQ